MDKLESSLTAEKARDVLSTQKSYTGLENGRYYEAKGYLQCLEEGPEVSSLRSELSSLRSDVGALVEAAEKALGIAESWIHGQLDGTKYLQGSLSKLASIRKALQPFRAQKEKR